MKLILNINKAVMKWLVHVHRQRALKRATARAYKAFIEPDPRWQKALFDDHFLTHRGAAVLRAYLKGLAPTPIALAQACADQWGRDSQAKATFVAALTPVAAHFLDLLEEELAGTRMPSGSFRSAAWFEG